MCSPNTVNEMGELPTAHPVGCLDMFHEGCLREWHKVRHGLYLAEQ